MDKYSEVYLLNGTFLVFDRDHALHLRRCRILSHPISGNWATGPYCLSPYAAHVVASNELATFKQLKLKQSISVEENRTKFELYIRDYIGEQKEQFIAKRLAELKSHNVEPSPRTLGEFDERKVRLDTKATPNSELSSFDTSLISYNEVIQIVNEQSERMLQLIYHDLYRRGFYVSSGMKFGCDFMAYLDDPVRYHAQYAIRLVSGNKLGLVDLEKLNFGELNSLQRLTHGANKILLFVSIKFAGDHSRDAPELSYWKLGERIYLTPGCKSSVFEPMEPDFKRPTPSNETCNKVIKTS